MNLALIKFSLVFGRFRAQQIRRCVVEWSRRRTSLLEPLPSDHSNKSSSDKQKLVRYRVCKVIEVNHFKNRETDDDCIMHIIKQQHL